MDPAPRPTKAPFSPAPRPLVLGAGPGPGSCAHAQENPPFPAPSRPATLPVPAGKVVFAAGGYGRFGVRRAGFPAAATGVPVGCRSLQRGGGQWSAAAGPGAGVRTELWPRAFGWVRLRAPDGRCPAARSSPSGHSGWCLNGPVGIWDLCKSVCQLPLLNARGKVFQSLRWWKCSEFGISANHGGERRWEESFLLPPHCRLNPPAPFPNPSFAVPSFEKQVMLLTLNVSLRENFGYTPF